MKFLKKKNNFAFIFGCCKSRKKNSHLYSLMIFNGQIMVVNNALYKMLGTTAAIHAYITPHKPH